MHKNDYFHNLHNSDQTREIITAAVSAFCDQYTDACLSLDIGFEKTIQVDSICDTTPRITLNILKADNYTPPPKFSNQWVNLTTGRETDADLLDDLPNSSISSLSSTTSYWSSLTSLGEKVSSIIKLKPKNSKDQPKHNRKPMKDLGNVFEKQVAVKWELPSGEFYAVMYSPSVPNRKLNFRKSTTELKTAQEVLATREKPKAKQTELSDTTDKDCMTLLTQQSTSRETLLKEINRELSMMSSSRKSRKSDKSTNTSSSVRCSPQSTSSSLTDTSEEVKQEDKKPAISIKRRSDTGELTILEEKDGIVKFVCFTKPMRKEK